jgi:DNA-binding transcriptional LysR family regulator
VDLDMAQVRAFVTVAEHSHFGRAAAELSLTQQALSKRIQRIEQLLGVTLLRRGTRGVELTEAGARFLPRAKELVAAAQDAVAEVKMTRRPVRIDVWGQIHAPLARIRELALAVPEDMIEISERRNLPSALTALLRGELDVAFGRVHDLGRAWPPQLEHQLIELAGGIVVMSTDSPVAGTGPLPAAELARARILAPTAGSSPELFGWWRRIAERFGMEMETGGNNLGLPDAITHLKADPSLVIVMGAPTQVPSDRGICLRPVTGPVPLYPWSAVWRLGEHDRGVVRLVRMLAGLSRTHGRTAFDPDRDWLPEPDLAGLPPVADEPDGALTGGVTPVTRTS